MLIQEKVSLTVFCLFIKLYVTDAVGVLAVLYTAVLKTLSNLFEPYIFVVELQGEIDSIRETLQTCQVQLSL